MTKLKDLTHPDDNPNLVRQACFFVGWHLRSPNSWIYTNVFTGISDEVTIPKLLEAVQAKRDRLANPYVEVKTVTIRKSKKR